MGLYDDRAPFVLPSIHMESHRQYPGIEKTVMRSLLAGFIIVAVVDWIGQWNTLRSLVSSGAIEIKGPVLAFASLVCLVVGGIRLQVGRGSVAFVLHSSFAVMAAFAMHTIVIVPMVTSGIAAAASLAWIVSFE